MNHKPKSNLRILIVTSSFPIDCKNSGNAGGFILDFGTKLQELGHKVTIISPQKSKIKSVEVLRIKSPINETSLSHLPIMKLGIKLKVIILMISGILNLLRLQLLRKYDRVLCFWALPSGVMNLPANIIFRIPMDVWMLGSDVWSAQNYPFGEKLLKFVAKRANFLLTDGIALGEMAFRKTSRRAIFNPSGRKLKSNITEENISEKFLIFVGRLHPNKGPDLLVQAYINVLSKLENPPSLYIYGDGPMRENLERMIESANCGQYIKLAGMLSEQDLPVRMKTAISVIIPSRIESIPLVLGQSAYYAKDILVTDVGDMGELAREYGIKNLCQPNVSSLEEGLLNAINNSESKKSTNLTNLSNFLSLDNSVLNYLKMIQTEVG